MARQEIARTLSPYDKRKPLVQALFERMRGSYLCDLFHAEYADYGLIPRADQESHSKPAEQKPPSSPRKEAKPPAEPPEARQNTEAQEAERLLARYSELEQGEIANVFKLLATTRRGGKIANSIILACLRTWDTIDVNRVLHGTRVYQDRGLHLEGKKEPYLKAIMVNATPAQITRKHSTATAPGDVSEVTQRNAQVLDLLRKEREDV